MNYSDQVPVPPNYLAKALLNRHIENLRRRLKSDQMHTEEIRHQYETAIVQASITKSDLDTALRELRDLDA